MEPCAPRSPTKTPTGRYAASFKSPRSKPSITLAAVAGLPSPPQPPSPEDRIHQAAALPPLIPNGAPLSPRVHRDAGITLRPLAFPLQLDRDYPVAQLDNWPLMASTALTWHGPAPSSPRQKGAASSSSPVASPLSPRVVKSHAHHKLFEDSKSKPQLLQELHAFAQSELRAMGLSRPSGNEDGDFSGSSPPNLQRLQVYRELFSRVIESFSVYAPLLAQIKDEYETAIQHLLTKCQLLPQLHGELQSLETQCLQQLSKHQIETKIQHKTLKQLLKHTQAKLAACAAENAHLQDENARANDQIKRLEQRYEEMHLSNHSLVNGMKRHDDTLRHIHERSREEGMALQQMTLKYHRACDEIAELKKTVATLEEKVGGVHVAADKATIALLTKDLLDMHAKLATTTTHHRNQLDELDGASLSQDLVLQKILWRVLEINGAASTETQLLEMVRAQCLGTNASSPTKSNTLLARTSSMVVTTSSLAASPSRPTIPSTAASTKPPLYHVPSFSFTDVSVADLTFAIERVASQLNDQIALFHHQTQQLEHRTKEQQPQQPTDPSSTFLTEPEEIIRGSAPSAHILAPLVSACDLIQTNGTDASIPEYLQYEGVVRNLFYDRRRVELLISKVWAYKEDLEGKAKRQSIGASPASSLRLAQVFTQYLQRCFPSNRHDQVECAYNVVAALGHFAHGSSDCRLFQLVLDGQLPDEARIDWSRDLAALHDALASMHRELKTQSHRVGVAGLPLADVVQALRRQFPWKSDTQLSRLHRSLMVDMRGHPLVDFSTLLQQSDDTCSRSVHAKARAKSQFVECLRAQYIDDLLGFRRHLQQHVSLLCTSSETVEGNTRTSDSSSSMVAVRVLRDCLQRCDPAKPVQEINRLLVLVTGLAMDQILTHDAMMVSASAFVAALPTLLLKPSGKYGGDVVAVAPIDAPASAPAGHLETS